MVHDSRLLFHGEEREKALEERIGRSDLRESFGQVLLPVERVQEVRNGRKYTSERRMYPGYVFIEMVMNDATWHLVNSTPRVIEFLGNNNPVVLSEAEVASIMAQMEQGSEKPRPKIEFEIGEEIRVKNGPFKDFNGRIEAVDYDKSRLQVFVSIFSRETLVDLDFNEVEKSKKFWRVACTPIFRWYSARLSHTYMGSSSN